MADHAASTGLVLSDKTYNALKWVVIWFLPASGTLYFTLGGIWGLPYGEQVVGTIVAVTLFFSVIMGIGNKSYNARDGAYDGALTVSDDGGGPTLQGLAIERTAEELQGLKSITIKVNATDEASQ